MRAKPIGMDCGSIVWMVVKMSEMFLWWKNAGVNNQWCNWCIGKGYTHYNEGLDSVTNELGDWNEEDFWIVAKDDMSATEGPDGVYKMLNFGIDSRYIGEKGSPGMTLKVKMFGLNDPRFGSGLNKNCTNSKHNSVGWKGIFGERFGSLNYSKTKKSTACTYWTSIL